ncbi:MAG: hypothetical protein WC027_03210 [Candidatus Paceibacterota bacterium]
MATKTMNPSKMTAAQAGRISDFLTTGLRKAGFQSEAIQMVIETKGRSLTDDLVAVVRKYVEAVSNLIVRVVDVDIGRKPQEALNATGRKQYTDEVVVINMPKGSGGKKEVVFFKPDLTERNGYISDDDLEKEFELRGLKPADPYSLAAVNEADPAFADDHPNGTHWKDANGNWSFAAFDRWHDERHVYVGRNDGGWGGGWWFGGLRK